MLCEMKYSIFHLTVISALLLSCENPADETTDASVKEKQAIATASSDSIEYTFSSTSMIKFLGSKVTGSHGGGFKKFSGSVSLEDGAPKSGSFTIDMTSTYSDSDKLTGHLTNADFFNVEAYPESKFEFTSFKKVSETDYSISGNLTMVGKTNNITFPAIVSYSEEKITLDAEFDIKRKDWGIVYPGKPDDLTRNEVVLTLKLEATPSR